MPLTVYESFWRILDDLPYTAVPNDYRAIASTSVSTVNVDPPPAWLAESYGVLTSLARSKLPSSAPSTGTLRDRMPQLEMTHLLHTEADVLRASFLYLFHPVHVAASRLLNTGNPDCRGELSATGGCRTDVRWVYRNGSQMTNIAVLEVKNTKVIHWNDFAFAMANTSNAKARRDAGFSSATSTLLRENAYWLSKTGKKVL